MGPPFLKKRLNIFGRDRSEKGSEGSKGKQDGNHREGTVTSAASSTADHQMRSEHRGDGPGAPVAGRGPSKGSRSDTAQPLWDRAYETLDPRLVKRYERLLSRELSKMGKCRL
jgi:hypothetical protein